MFYVAILCDGMLKWPVVCIILSDFEVRVVFLVSHVLYILNSKSAVLGGQWWGGLLITGGVVGVASVLAVVGVRKYRERMEGINRFRELQKSQMRGRAESDDDEYDSDPYEDEVSKKHTAVA